MKDYILNLILLAVSLLLLIFSIVLYFTISIQSYSKSGNGFLKFENTNIILTVLGFLAGVGAFFLFYTIGRFLNSNHLKTILCVFGFLLFLVIYLFIYTDLDESFKHGSSKLFSKTDSLASYLIGYGLSFLIVFSIHALYKNKNIPDSNKN